MFVNIKAYNADDQLIYEVNPYDYTAGTLKGLNYNYQPGIPAPSPLGLNEVYVDKLVYEEHPSSTLTEESEQTFHFALATDRYKDNRIPPKGFRIDDAGARLAQPRWDGADDPDYFTVDEYAGGYDDVARNIPSGAAYVEISLYYQTTSREYLEFLRDEINGNTNNMTLPEIAYIIQSDPFFSQLKAWGNTIWSLWTHNMNVDGAKPFLMSQTKIVVSGAPTPTPAPCVTAGTPQNLSAAGGRRRVTLTWDVASPAPTGGYNIYYDQAGKLQYIDGVSADTLSYRDNKLQQRLQYCYRVTAWNDCNANGSYDSGIDTESGASGIACATTK